MTDRYIVIGMSCAACQARVEKAVSALEGVDNCNVNLLTNTMHVEGSASHEEIIKAVQKAGYDASIVDASFSDADAIKELVNNKDIGVLKRRLILSAVILLIMLIISHAGKSSYAGGLVAIGVAEAVLALVVIIINRAFFVRGLRGLLHGAANMDTLVAMGAGIAYLWSLYSLAATAISMSVAEASFAERAASAAVSNIGEFYFVSAAMILTFITIGKLLEAVSKGRTSDAIRELMNMVPDNATVVRDGEELSIPADELIPGDICIVKAGERIPADGVIVTGEAAIDESVLTGESMPIDRGQGDFVKAATICQSGYLRFEVKATGKDTSLSGIIRLVAEASSTKAPIARVADRIAAVFVPSVMLISAIVFAAWLIMGQGVSFALTRAISVMLISCPCALGLATPVAIMAGSGVGAKHGILFKTAAALEEMGRIDIIAFDKTGTVTEGKPVLTDVIPAEGIEPEELKSVAYSLEIMSDHPLARAVCEYCDFRDGGMRSTVAGECKTVECETVECETIEHKTIENETIGREKIEYELTDFVNVNGRGLMARMQLATVDAASGDTATRYCDAEKRVTAKGDRVAGGNAGFIEEFLDLEDDEEDDAAVMEWIEKTEDALSREGKTVIFWARGDKLLGALALADEPKADSADAIEKLKALGKEIVIISGDNDITTRAVAKRVGIEDVVAGVLPSGKDKAVKALMQRGKTAMVGDGINDAPALTRADVGVAIGAGTDVAIAAAQLVLVNSSIMDVVKAVKLGKATLRIIHQNLFWAFFYNILLIPLASGLFTGVLGGWTLSPALASAAMSISSFTVCVNALRLNRVKL